MAQKFSIRFDMNSPDAREQFIEEYALEAIDRLTEFEDCNSLMFVPGIDQETGERSGMSLSGAGDLDALIDYERDRWDTLVEEDVVVEWERELVMGEEEIAESVPQEVAEWHGQLEQLSSEMFKIAYGRFDDLDKVPGAAETFSEYEDTQLGWWVILHNLTVQMGYDLTEELDVYTHGVEHTLRNFAEYEGEDAAEERIDALIAELEGMREDVKEGRRA